MGERHPRRLEEGNEPPVASPRDRVAKPRQPEELARLTAGFEYPLRVGLAPSPLLDKYVRSRHPKGEVAPAKGGPCEDSWQSWPSACC